MKDLDGAQFWIVNFYVWMLGILGINAHSLSSRLCSNSSLCILQMNLCLRNVSNLLDLEYFCLCCGFIPNVKAWCITAFHRLAQKRGIWRFFGGIGSIFCLIMKQKAGLLVGMCFYGQVCKLWTLSSYSNSLSKWAHIQT